MADELAGAALIGRAISLLQATQGGGYDRWTGKNWKYIKPERVLTDEQIQEILNLTPKRMKTCLEAWRLHPPRKLTTDEIHQRFSDFVKKENRWPRHTDYKAWRDNGLGPRGYELSCQEKHCAKHWKTLPAEMVFGIRNLTTRRDVIRKRGGEEKLIQEGAGVKVQEDDFGILWKLPFPDGADKHAMYVEVINSSPRLDKNNKPIKRNGSFVCDHYFLRVPPTTKTAREGVAWTFDMSPDEFVGFAAQS